MTPTCLGGRGARTLATTTVSVAKLERRILKTSVSARLRHRGEWLGKPSRNVKKNNLALARCDERGESLILRTIYMQRNILVGKLGEEVAGAGPSRLQNVRVLSSTGGRTS